MSALFRQVVNPVHLWPSGAAMTFRWQRHFPARVVEQVHLLRVGEDLGGLGPRCLPSGTRATAMRGASDVGGPVDRLGVRWTGYILSALVNRLITDGSVVTRRHGEDLPGRSRFSAIGFREHPTCISGRK